MRVFSLGLMALSAACLLLALPKSASAAPNLLTEMQSQTAGAVEQVGHRRYYRRHYAYRSYYRPYHRYGYYRPYYRPYAYGYGYPYYRRPGLSFWFGF
jgi:hypothetical protein